jgi:hypothetical protein
MSDYLWDKTGEADPEVERLEGLLGGFAHRPGRVELPPEVAAPTRTSRPRLARYAAAAALLLAALAGALVTLRPAETHEARLPAPQNSPAAPSAVPAAAPSAVRSDDPGATVVKEREERAAAVEVVERAAPRHRAPQARTPRQPAGRRRAAPAEVLEAPEVLEVARVEGVEEAPPMPGRAIASALGRGFSVKRQLFSALLLTSTKLKEVQRQTQGADAEAPDERNRSR